MLRLNSNCFISYLFRRQSPKIMEYQVTNIGIWQFIFEHHYESRGLSIIVFACVKSGDDCNYFISRHRVLFP